MIIIENYTSAISQQWDDYVNKHPEGSFFHLSSWVNVIANSFKHKSYYLYAIKNNVITGVLPLVEVKSVLFGHALVSTPFCVYGGAISNSSEVTRALETKATEIATSLQVDYLELRYQTEQDNQLQLKTLHTSFGCTLPESADAMLLAIKKKQRAVIRHSLKNELQICDGDLSQFYKILSISYRNLGTPIFTQKYFKNLVEEFNDKVKISLVKDAQGKVLSGVMTFYFGDQVIPYYGGGIPESRQKKSMDFMYFNLMKSAIDNGLNWFDFGRSKNESGPYKYKLNWGMTPKPLFYYYYCVRANELPNLSPNNPKYKYFIKMWQKLPLKISQLLGPFLAKNLG